MPFSTIEILVIVFASAFSALLAILLFVLIYSRHLLRKRRHGGLTVRQRIDMATGETLNLLQREYDDWGLSKKSLPSLERLIDSRREHYGADALLRDRNFVQGCGAFLGTVLVTYCGCRWDYAEPWDESVLRTRDGVILYPFGAVEDRIRNGEAVSLVALTETDI
jgi:hypothetical protein